MKTKLIALAALLLVLFSVSLSAEGNGEQEIEKVSLILNWRPVGDHAPYFVALKKGWYAEEALEVDIQVGKGSGFAVQSVDTGKADFGIADTAVSVTGRAKGASVRVVSALFAKSPNCVHVWKDSGITHPRDLVGKTVGVPAADTQKVMFPAFAAIIGIDPDQVKFVNIDPAAKTAALATRKVDAIFDLYTGRPLHEQAIPADQLVSLLWADYGFQAYSNSIITTDKMIEENPDLIKRFIRASLRGWEWTLQNPEEAIKILGEYHTINQTVLLENLRYVMDFFHSDDYEKNGLGHIDPEAMAATVGLVANYMGVDVTFSVDEMYTNDFLPKPKIELPDF